ncbi:PAS domain S-box protein [Niveibacterium terrae]|uniref:PAS domain S-box protein n=1 Tax=Niveibacterium terrae TaxID=3373598 RepID=UPI003A95A428
MKHRLTVRRAILVAVMLGLLLPALLVGAIGGRIFFAESLRERSDEALNQYGEVLALGLQEPLWSFNPVAANKLIEAVMRSPDVYKIEVRDATLGTFVASEKAERRTDRSYHTERTIVQDGRRLGTVRIEISDALVVQSVRSRLLTLAITLAAQILIGFVLITLVLERRLVRPLQRVGEESMRLAEGMLDKPIQALSDDEIGVLEQRLEETRCSLRKLIAAVEEKNRQLEVDLVERLRAEQAAHLSEARLRDLVEQSPIAIIEIGADHQIHEWNAAAERIFGWRREEALAQSISFILPDDSTAAEDLFAPEDEETTSRSKVLTNKTRKGSEITCQWYNNLVRGAQGQPERIVAMAEDITEQRRAEQEIALLARVVSHTTNIVIITDAEGRISWTNMAFCRISGWTTDEVRGRRQDEFLIGPATQTEARNRLNAAIARGEGIDEVEILYYARNGSSYWVQKEIQPIHDESGQILQFMTVETDITERKQAELRTLESRRMLQTVLDTIPVRVYWKDRESRYLGCNAQFAADTLRTPEELRGQLDSSQIWSHNASAIVRDDLQILQSGQARLNFEEERRSDGGSYWLRHSKVPLRDAEEHIIGVLGVYDDVTDRKTAELALARSEQRLRALIDNAPLGVFEFELGADGELSLVTSNPQADRILGLDCGLLRGMTTQSAFPQFEETGLKRALVEAINTGRRYSHGELPYSLPHGPALLEVFAFQTGPQRVAMLFRDVSDLRRAAEGMRRLAEASDSERDPDFFAHLLEHLCEATGATAALLIQASGDGPHRLAHHPAALDADLHSPILRRVLGGVNLVIPADARGAFPDEKTLIDTSAEALIAITVPGEDGNQAGALVALFASPLRNAELPRSLAEIFAQRAGAEMLRQHTLAALRESEARFSLTFQLAPIPMSISRLTDGMMFDANKTFCDLFALNPDEIAGRTSSELGLFFSDADRAGWVSRVASEDVVSGHAVPMRTRDGRTIEARIWARKLTNEDPPKILVNIVDLTRQESIRRELENLTRTLETRVTERTHDLEETLDRLRLTQNELVRSEKLAALGGLVAGVAHELNTPIGNSMMVASTLRDATSGIHSGFKLGLKRSELEAYLDEANSATEILLRNLERAGELISSFKQVAVDQTSSQRRKFTLDELITEIVLTLRPMLKKTPYTVELDVPKGISLDSYPGPLGQVATNLISNSVIHGFENRDHGEIRIAAKSEADSVILTVSDNGLGIPAEHMKKIFDPFFTTKRGRQGSGLGLHIAHNIVTGVLGGQIRVDSEPGQGTRFTIHIPCTAPHSPETPRE